MNFGLPGRELVQRLLLSSTSVSVLDKVFLPDELESIYTNLPNAKSLLQVKLGDVRDEESLKAVMTPDLVGVVHLAAVSRVGKCSENESECMDVNGRGTELVASALKKMNKKDGGSRWLLLASSSAVYGDPETLPVTEQAETVPTSSFGTSMLKAEEAVRRTLGELETDGKAGSLHASVLRLTQVYGSIHDHADRLIPSIITHALPHQVIQLSGTRQNVSDNIGLFVLNADSKVTSSSIYSTSTTASMRSSSPSNDLPSDATHTLLSRMLLTPLSRCSTSAQKAKSPSRSWST